MKKTAALSKCFIRTGENVVFSNIIVQAGYFNYQHCDTR
ncbi:hypothetical protein G9U52_21565 [Paenibacillus sp. S3N08]|uniref:Uncharacterized protein n=1 Tax=Paenibacillus agricola TaxID=2716264 RepID=A0ABX0JB27_9BACL|nr:hypothetical protein [Paenibacillus agricola]